MQIKFVDQGKEVFVLRSWAESVLALLAFGALNNLAGDIGLAWSGRSVPPTDFAVDATFIGAYALAFALVRRRSSRRAAAGEEAVLRAVNHHPAASNPIPVKEDA